MDRVGLRVQTPNVEHVQPNIRSRSMLILSSLVRILENARAYHLVLFLAHSGNDAHFESGEYKQTIPRHRATFVRSCGVRRLRGKISR